MVCGDIIADIGSDHAYLPIWLYLNKKIKKAYAVDISEKCVKRIKANLKKYNIPENIITPVLSDGLAYFENENDIAGVTDVIIAGTGGKTISGIIEDIKNPANLNFILQPSSKSEFLRKFLYDNKFNIINEIIVVEGKWIYDIINAKFTGQEYKPDPLDIIAGKDITHAGYIDKIIRGLNNIIKDLDKKSCDKYNIKTEFGYYKDIENLISKLELRKS